MRDTHDPRSEQDDDRWDKYPYTASGGSKTVVGHPEVYRRRGGICGSLFHPTNSRSAYQ